MKIKLTKQWDDGGYEFRSEYDVDGRTYTTTFFAKGHGDANVDDANGNEVYTFLKDGQEQPNWDVIAITLAMFSEGPCQVGEERDWTIEELESKREEYAL